MSIRTLKITVQTRKNYITNEQMALLCDSLQRAYERAVYYNSPFLDLSQRPDLILAEITESSISWCYVDNDPPKDLFSSSSTGRRALQIVFETIISFESRKKSRFVRVHKELLNLRKLFRKGVRTINVEFDNYSCILNKESFSQVNSLVEQPKKVSNNFEIVGRISKVDKITKKNKCVIISPSNKRIKAHFPDELETLICDAFAPPRTEFQFEGQMLFKDDGEFDIFNIKSIKSLSLFNLSN